MIGSHFGGFVFQKKKIVHTGRFHSRIAQTVESLPQATVISAPEGTNAGP